MLCALEERGIDIVEWNAADTVSLPRKVCDHFGIQHFYQALMNGARVIIAEIEGNLFMMPDAPTIKPIEPDLILDRMAEVLGYLGRVVEYHAYSDPIYFLDGVIAGVVCDEGATQIYLSVYGNIDSIAEQVKILRENDPTHQPIEIALPSGEVITYAFLQQVAPLSEIKGWNTPRLTIPPRRRRPRVLPTSNEGRRADANAYWEANGLLPSMDTVPIIQRWFSSSRRHSGIDTQRIVEFMLAVLNEQFNNSLHESFHAGSTEYRIVHRDDRSLLMADGSTLLRRLRADRLRPDDIQRIKDDFSELRAEANSIKPIIVSIGKHGLEEYTNEWWLPAIRRYVRSL